MYMYMFLKFIASLVNSYKILFVPCPVSLVLVRKNVLQCHLEITVNLCSFRLAFE